jgi:xanthine dehydrogenase accessory factor
MDRALAVVRDLARDDEEAVLATVVAVEPEALSSALAGAPRPSDGPGPGAKMVVRPGAPALGTFGRAALDEAVRRDALDALATGRSTLREYRRSGDAVDEVVTVFHQVLAPPARVVIVGANSFGVALARVAAAMGYRVSVCDPRPAFTSAPPLVGAGEVATEWPDRFLAARGDRLGPRDAVCVLSHDHKIDVPAITAALETPVGYLGVMGSRRTHAERIERLRDQGVSPAQLARVMAPIGLDIGARTPEETAVAIMAEVVALRAGRPASSLRDGTGAIHPRPA